MKISLKKIFSILDIHGKCSSVSIIDTLVKVSKKTGKGLEACNQCIRLSEKAVMWLQYAVKSFLVGPPQGERTK